MLATAPDRRADPVTTTEGGCAAAEAAAQPPRWRRRAVYLGTLAAVAVLVLVSRRDLPAAAAAVRHASVVWIGALALLTGLGIVNLGLVYWVGQRAAGVRMRAREGIVLGTAATFVNLLAKSNGLAGVMLFTGRARRKGEPTGPAVAGYLLVNVVGHLALGLVLAISLGALALAGAFTKLDAVAAGVFVVFMTVTVGGLAAALRSRSAVRALYALPQRLERRLRHLVKRRAGPERMSHSAADELYEAVLELRRERRRAVPVFLLALAVDLIAVAQIYAAMQAVGAPGGLTVALAGYGISTLLGVIGLLPGGLGFVELSLAAVLIAAGTPAGAAAAAVVLYRLAELWVPLAAGAVAAHSTSRAGTTGR